MGNYIQKIHDIIDKVNPSVYVDKYPEFSKQVLIISLLMFAFGLLLVGLNTLLSRYASSGGDKALSSTGWFFVCCSVIFVLVWAQSYRKPIKDTLTDTSKAQISEYVGHLSNDDYITLQKYVTSYGQQVDLPTEQERAVNNRLIEIFK